MCSEMRREMDFDSEGPATDQMSGDDQMPEQEEEASPLLSPPLALEAVKIEQDNRDSVVGKKKKAAAAAAAVQQQPAMVVTGWQKVSTVSLVVIALCQVMSLFQGGTPGTTAEQTSAIDCVGHWSECTAACELASSRSWVQTTVPNGAGRACPAAGFAGAARADCQVGDGTCQDTAAVVGGAATGISATSPYQTHLPGWAGVPAAACQLNTSSTNNDSYSFQQDERPPRCIPMWLHPESAGFGDKQAGFFRLVFTGETARYRTTRVHAAQTIEVLGRDPSGALVNFRGGFHVSAPAPLLPTSSLGSAMMPGTLFPAGAASLALDRLAFRGLVDAGWCQDGGGGEICGGGVIWIGMMGTLRASNAEFTGNSCSNGGAIAVGPGGIATITNSVFTRNIAKIPQNGYPTTQKYRAFGLGGAIYVAWHHTRAGVLDVSSSKFYGNEARIGGSIYMAVGTGPGYTG
eukprot:COSAG01_NODE_13003_length_1650_cov_4.249516_1_plen_460_part_10